MTIADDTPLPVPQLDFSRRRFMRSSALIAGAASLTRWLEQPAAASHRKSMGDSSPTAHPLDPLGGDEIRRACSLLAAEKKLAESGRFVTVTLQEPAKALLDAWKPGQPWKREAFVLVMDVASGLAHEAVVDLTAGAIDSFEPLPEGLQPPIMPEEFIQCELAIRRSPLFQQTLAKRGVEDPELVMVDPWSAGMYGTEAPQDEGKRLARALCFVRSEPEDNGYARPLDGVIVVVDLHRMEVLRVEDYGVVPLPPESGNWASRYLPTPRSDLKPLEISQPDGPSFHVSGREVTWQKWKFRVGFTPREGLVLHDIRYRDDDRERPVLQRAAICEMVVPYGDPAEKHFRKNAFDIGEYGIGMMANSLRLGCDCLGAIHYFDADLADHRGHSMTIKNAVCLHEEDAGLLWKHTDWRTNQTESRRSRRLSASFIATVGNYEYGFFWHFYQDGSLEYEVKLTGIMNTTALLPDEEPEFGVEIAPRLNAPFHQHIFAARINPCVDGPQNSIYEVNMVSLPRGEANPHGNAFRAEATLLARESDAKRKVHSASGRFWRIVNPASLNRLGRPVGYRLLPGENSPVLVQPDAAVMRRAGFTAHNLWVTLYSPLEMYAAGNYPNQHPTGDGLPIWSANDRSLENTDLVVWYVFGHNHVPRPEDWPVMPVASIGFKLKPDGFFDRNPALDVPSIT